MWLTNVNALAAREARVYLSAIIGCYDGKVVAAEIGTHPSMVSTWEGEAAVAYNQAQAKWDKASQELNTVLATISKTVSQGNDAMSDVNRRAAASWG